MDVYEGKVLLKHANPTKLWFPSIHPICLQENEAPLHHAMCAVAAALAMFHNFICEGYEKKGKHCLNNDSLEKHMI